MSALPTCVDLPDEVLVRIFSYIEDQHSLTNVTLTSRRLNRLATTVLYRDITIALPFDYDDKEERDPAFTMLARQILASPTHANMVRSLKMHDFWIDEKPIRVVPFKGLESAIRSKLELLLPASEIRNACEKELLPVIDGIMESSWTVFIALCMPNLQRLHLSPGWADLARKGSLESRFRDLLGANDEHSRSSSQAQIWPRLQEVIIEGRGDKYPDSTEDLANFAHLRTLKTLTGSALGDGDNGDENPEQADDAFVALTPRSLSLERLSIHSGSKLKIPNLDRLLQTPKGLRSFEYEFGHSWSWIPFKTDALQSSLQHQRNSLEELSLRVSDRDCFLDPGYDLEEDFDVRLNAMDFSGFTVLKKLTIDPTILFGIDVVHADIVHCESSTRATDRNDSSSSNNLAEVNNQQRHQNVTDTKDYLRCRVPPSLETLEVLLYGGETLAKRLTAAIDELLKHRRKAAPNLKRVSILTHPDKLSDYQQQTEPFLSAVAETLGVVLDVMPRDPGLWIIEKRL